MTPQMQAAVAAATNRQRIDLVMECLRQFDTGGTAPEVWKAIADYVSDWEADHEAGPVDHRLILAVDALPEHQAYLLPRLMVASRDDLIVACGLEVEAARMRLLETDHAVWEATRQTWPETESD
jgi:hypothetical protein